MSGERKDREVLSVTASVGALMSYSHVIDGDKLCLVRKAGTGKWALPSGGITRHPQGRIETQAEALRREILEETGLDVNKLTRKPELLGNVLVSRSNGNYSLGIIFQITLGTARHDPELNINNSAGELDEARFFDPWELYELLKDPENNLNRPDINDGLIRWWARNYWTHDNMGETSHRDGPIDEVLIKKLSNEKAWW
jgi:8-oxo-dGTP pyrophosphatase MutT (NUDIX family)